MDKPFIDLREECSQCGFLSHEFNEGVCYDCFEQNQNDLDAHNAAHDHWQSLSDAERKDAIRRAY